MISNAEQTTRRGTKWKDGSMKFWVAAGMLEAERSFRHICGHKDLAKLADAFDARSRRVLLHAKVGTSGRLNML